MDVSGSKELENVQPPALARNLSDLQNSLSILRLSNKVLSCQVDDQEEESGKVTLAALARIYNLGQVIRVITLVVKISDELAAARNDVVTAKQKFFQMELQNIYYSISDNVKNIIEVCELFPHENLNPHIMEENLNHIRASLLCILELCEKFARADKKSWFNNRMFTWSRSVLRRVYEAKTQLPYEFGQINEMHLIEDE
ncbi:uncharacterized protein LOC117123076 isoform X2 [Anneissia japonica]|uniref:uncharacterized protein LOC117123076 isoform X2 n=1 Tax=Anneissia japonica TaxID=1529436 RepID=UPI001425B1CA|nr:uncharacterized protein LOC117123076 isoform X2 [Anneissia japonica]